MPPLQMFGRRWNIGSDDFVYISLSELLLLIALILIYLLYVDVSESPFKCDIDLFQKIIYFGLGFSMLCSVLLTIVLMILSARGTIMNDAPRSGVPYCIYCKIVVLAVEIIICGLGISMKFQSTTSFGNCSKKINQIYQIIFYCLLTCLLIYLLMFWIYYDRLSHLRKFQNGTNLSYLTEVVDIIKRKQIWKERLQCLLCMFKPSYQEKNALDDVANLLAVFNKGSDLVCSDYQAGFYLMKLEDDKLNDLSGCSLKHYQHQIDEEFNECYGPQEHFLILANANNSNIINGVKERRDTVLLPKKPISKLFRSVLAFFKEKSIVPNYAHRSEYVAKIGTDDDELADQKLSELLHNPMISGDSNLSPSPPLSIGTNNSVCCDTADWRDLRLVYYFATMAKASYGWPLNLLFRDKDGSCLKFCRDVYCQSHCCSKCICCENEISHAPKHLIIYPKGKFCAYHRKAILNESHFQKENLICVSFYNKEYYSPFFVAVSHEMKIVILSIRGSFSLKDILTDLNVQLIGFEENHLTDCLAHSGMTQSAYKLKHILYQSDILAIVMRENKDYRLVLTGHSLGAGIAVILACMLYSDYPTLKCYAFGIPFGTVNIKMADYCKDFVLTIINGYDWIPRLSCDSIKIVEARLNKCLLNYHHPKFSLTAAMCGFFRRQPDASDNQWNILNVFQRDWDDQYNIDSEIKLPGQIIHIVNLKTLPDLQKMNSNNGSVSSFIPIISSGEQFKSLIIRCDMFSDHFPSCYVNRLFSILKSSNIFTTRCHHYLKHFWPRDNSIDNIKLPSLGFLEEKECKIIIDRKRSEKVQEKPDYVYEVMYTTTVI